MKRQHIQPTQSLHPRTAVPARHHHAHDNFTNYQTELVPFSDTAEFPDTQRPSRSRRTPPPIPQSTFRVIIPEKLFMSSAESVEL